MGESASGRDGKLETVLVMFWDANGAPSCGCHIYKLTKYPRALQHVDWAKPQEGHNNAVKPTELFLERYGQSYSN